MDVFDEEERNGDRALSVVIPTFNRPQLLKMSLDHYLRQRGLAELIVINDGSTEAVDGIIDHYKTNPKIVYIRHKEKKGSSYSINEGVRHSTTDLVFFSADDILLGDNSLVYVSEYISRMNEERIACVGGRIFSVDYNLFKLISQGSMKIDGKHLHQFASGKLPDVSNLTGEVTGSFSAGALGPTPVGMLHGAVAVHRKAFLQMKGFDWRRYVGNHYREETDFHLRALRNGYKLIYDPRIVLFHYHQEKGGQNSNLFLYQYYVLRNHAFFLSRFYGFKTLFMLPLFIPRNLATVALTSRLNKIFPSEYFSHFNDLFEECYKESRTEV